MQAFDLHTHSIYSDGTQTPAAIVRAAKEAGLAFVALTDHDTVMGVPEAMAEGARIGMRVVPGVEYDIDYSVTMHILGLGIDPDAPEVKRTLAESAVRLRGATRPCLRASGRLDARSRTLWRGMGLLRGCTWRTHL
mgnify:CR=1 FL=1